MKPHPYVNNDSMFSKLTNEKQLDYENSNLHEKRTILSQYYKLTKKGSSNTIDHNTDG